MQRLNVTSVKSDIKHVSWPQYLSVSGTRTSTSSAIEVCFHCISLQFLYSCLSFLCIFNFGFPIASSFSLSNTPSHIVTHWHITTSACRPSQSEAPSCQCFPFESANGEMRAARRPWVWSLRYSSHRLTASDSHTCRTHTYYLQPPKCPFYTNLHLKHLLFHQWKHCLQIYPSWGRLAFVDWEKGSSIYW